MRGIKKNGLIQLAPFFISFPYLSSFPYPLLGRVETRVALLLESGLKLRPLLGAFLILPALPVVLIFLTTEYPGINGRTNDG